MKVVLERFKKCFETFEIVRECSGLLIAASLTLCSNSFAAPSCPKGITIGWEEYKPFQFEEGGVVKGSDMEIFDLLMKKLGCSYKAEKTPWDRTLMDVQNGQKLFAAGATMTAERQKFAFFTAPYDVEKIYAYVLKKNLKSMHLKNITEIISSNYKIVTTSGVTYGDDFDALVKEGKLVKDKNLFEATTEKQAWEMVALGRVDIYLASGEGLPFHPDIASGKDAAFTTETRFMISKKASNEAFLTQVNAAIASLTKDGSFKKIKKKYLVAGAKAP